MTPRSLYAVHFTRRGPWPARLYRFQSASLRALRVEADPRRWRIPRTPVVARVATRADRARAWRYERPGTWSTRVGPLRAAWWRLRA